MVQLIRLQVFERLRNVMPESTRVQSYDDVQVSAVLAPCAGCGRLYYWTVPRPRCVTCEQKMRTA